MKKLPIDMCVFRRLQLTVVCVSEASTNYVNIVYVPPFRYNNHSNLTLFLWLNKLQVIHQSRYQINGKKICSMFRRLQLFRRLQWLTESWFLSLIFKQCGISQLFIDKWLRVPYAAFCYIDWMSSCIDICTNWLNSFVSEASKLLTENVLYPFKLHFFFYKQCNQANVVITWKFIHQVLYQDQMK